MSAATSGAESDPREIAVRIWMARLHAGLEPDEAAARLGYATEHLSQLEEGAVSPTHAELVAIALLTGCRLAFLKRGSLPVRSPQPKA